MVSTDPLAEVDVSPIVVSEIEVDGVRLVAPQPLEFEVTYDQDDALYDLEGPLEIYLFAETRETLREMLREDLEYLWRHFAVGDPSKITPGAQRLGEDMQRMFAVDSNAA